MRTEQYVDFSVSLINIPDEKLNIVLVTIVMGASATTFLSNFKVCMMDSFHNFGFHYSSKTTEQSCLPTTEQSCLPFSQI